MNPTNVNQIAKRNVNQIAKQEERYDLDGNPYAGSADSDLRRQENEKESKVGLNSKKNMADVMGVHLATSFALYLKCQYFHWNVTGKQFLMAHKLFELQYKELAEIIDQTAERIRALGFRSPGTFSEFVKLSSIEEDVTVPSMEKMMEILSADYEALIKKCAEIGALSDKSGDLATSDLISRQTSSFQKTLWIMRSHSPKSEGSKNQTVDQKAMRAH